MQKITLYRYNRPYGGVTLSPQMPDCDYTELVRQIADEGKILVKGDIQTICADVDTDEGWEEIDAPEEESQEE